LAAEPPPRFLQVQRNGDPFVPACVAGNEGQLRLGKAERNGKQPDYGSVRRTVRRRFRNPDLQLFLAVRVRPPATDARFRGARGNSN
jgi:hypothetical protein